MEEEMSGLRAVTVEALTALRNFVHTDWKKNMAVRL
jgi:hypothetical protein